MKFGDGKKKILKLKRIFGSNLGILVNFGMKIEEKSWDKIVEGFGMGNCNK